MEDILRELVAFPTVTGDKVAAHGLLQYVADFVTQRGMHVQWHESHGFESIVATIQPDHRTPTVMLAAHADVVPADPSLFKLKKIDGRYEGRGVLDMKFAIAAYLQTIDELHADLHDYDIGLMITTDEETGGINGTAHLVNQGYLPAVCIMPDGGEDWQIQTASKGSCAFEIAIIGKTAHGSRPWLGDNALIKLIGVLDEIATLFPRHPSADTNTITLSKLNGGEVANQVPGNASMTIDVRTLDSAEYARIGTAIQDICRQHNANCRLLVDIVPTYFSLDNPYIAPFAAITEAVTDIHIVGSRTNGSNDARWYVPYGIPCISVYPTGSGLHGDEEWLDVIAFEQFQQIIRQYVEQIARTPPHSSI